MRLERLSDPTSPAFDDMLRIYAASIAVPEQKTPAEIRAAVADPGYRFIVASEGPRVLGFAAVYSPDGGAFDLLEYMAVEPGQRNRGLGAELVRRAVADLATAGREGPLLLEVDALGGQDDGREIRRRRIEFYRRLGCRQVAGMDYLLPLERQGPPPPMILMVRYPASSPASVPAAALAGWLATIYAEVYGCRRDDPRVGAMLAAAGEPVLLV